MKKGILLFLSFWLMSNLVIGQAIFINEINYKDVNNQGIELAGPAGADISGWKIYLYDNSGNLYHTETIPTPTSIPSTGSTYNTIWFPVAELHDTNNDGEALYLVDNANNDIQFIGYSLTSLPVAQDLPAQGQTPDNIGIVQVLSANSLQLIGTGTTYPDFTWSVVGTTIGAINQGQTFSPLPVELTHFNAQQLNNKVVLNWSTASEIDNDYFVIERSIDGFEFESIGIVKGKGTTFEKSNYHFADHSILGQMKAYYRLRQVDIDGSEEFSDIIVVELTNISTIVIYPNPIKRSESLMIDNQNNGPLSFELYDVSGQILKHIKFEGKLILDTTELSEGFYFYKLIDEQSIIKTGKLLIVID